MADVDEQEKVILQLAAGQLKREEFVAWVKAWNAPTLEDETLESAFAKLA